MKRTAHKGGNNLQASFSAAKPGKEEALRASPASFKRGKGAASFLPPLQRESQEGGGEQRKEKKRKKSRGLSLAALKERKCHAGAHGRLWLLLLPGMTVPLLEGEEAQACLAG